MELLRWKTRLAVLWIIQAVAFAAVVFLALLRLRGNLEASVNEQTRILVTFFFFIPCFMAWMSMTLKDSANRWLSLVLGIVFAVIKLLSMIGVLSSAAVLAANRFNEFWGLLGAVLIIGYAWKMPKQEA